MNHAYFSNLGNKVMALPDSECSVQPMGEVTIQVCDELTLIVVAATSIFSLPEIQLEKETVRQAVTPDPGDAHAHRHTPLPSLDTDTENYRQVQTHSQRCMHTQ